MKKVLFFLFMIIIIITSLVVFVTNPYFAISEIFYKGNNFVSKKRLVQISSVMKGKNILCVLFLKNYKKETLRELAEIHSITFTISFPNKMHINVKEKKEWVSFLTEAHNYIISKDGAILNRSSQNAYIENLENLIIIHGIPDMLFKSKYIDQNLLEKTKKVVDNIKFYFPYQNIQIEFQSDNNIILIKDDSLPIKIGNLEYLDLKFRNLKHFLKAYPKNISSLEYIDLRVEDKIIVKKISNV